MHLCLCRRIRHSRRMGSTCSLSVRTCSSLASPALLRLLRALTRRRVQPSGRVLQRSLHLLSLESTATLPCISMSRAIQQIASTSLLKKNKRQLQCPLLRKCVTQVYGSGMRPLVHRLIVSTGLHCPFTQRHLDSCCAMARHCMPVFSNPCLQHHAPLL